MRKWCLINTRPESRADELSQVVTEAGFAVYNMPLMQIEWIDEAIQLPPMFSKYALIIIISPTAATIFVQYLHSLPSDTLLNLRQSLQCIAVGQSTAAILTPYLHNVSVPTTETSEGILSTHACQALQAYDKVLVIRGQGGRRLIDQTMLTRGIQLDAWEVYKRSMPTDIAKRWADIDSSYSPVLLISSIEAWENWCQSMAQQRFQGVILAMGRRNFQTIQNQLEQNNAPPMLHYGKVWVEYIPDLKPTTILTAIHRLTQERNDENI